MPITVPVPEEYAKEFDAKNPSTYDTHVVATGPYMVKNDAQGKVVGYSPGKRSRSCATPTGTRRPTTGRPTSDEISSTKGNDDPKVAARRSSTAKACDSTPTARERCSSRR